MTQTEALRLALEALETSMYPQQKQLQAITAIKAALEAKDEPVKLRRGDMLRCNESDELCTVWATSTSGKTLVKWKDNDFGNYTAEQIGELFWIEPKEKDEPEYYGLTKDHLWMSISKEHYDRLKPEFRMTCYTTPPQQEAKDEPVARVCEGFSSDEKHAIDYWQGDVDDLPIGTQLYTTPPQRKPLSDEELRNHYQSNEWLDGVRFAEQFHGIKGEA